jgi:hypothetical protein
MSRNFLAPLQFEIPAKLKARGNAADAHATKITVSLPAGAAVGIVKPWTKIENATMPKTVVIIFCAALTQQAN